ncbi:hypothetical protein BDW74DRAFT_179777 [Aspergillus multicolor]|uniref:uncharacterized protein n=1 Tax=Aspergillus multicolor TaxID=41759 RepID=UPI003CCCC7AB
MASTAKRTEDCLAELEAQFRETKTPSSVLLILGRTGAGKSSLLEDLSGLSGYSEQNADSVTKTTALCKATINGSPYYIMDTPGFDPGTEGATFTQIARGLARIRPFTRLTGILYLTSIAQERFDNFDRKLIRFVLLLSARAYIPRVTFITTFWTATPGQALAFDRRLEGLQGKWEEGVRVQGLKAYQHGRVYEDGKDTGVVIDWFVDRGRIACYAREMVVRNYGVPSNAMSEIERDLDHDVPMHEMAAGKLLGLAAPSPSQSDTTEEAAKGSAQGGSASTKKDGSEPKPEGASLGQVVLDGISWFFRNVQIDVGVGGGGGGGGGMGPRSNHGDPFRGGGDPLSHVDYMKSTGMDWSRAGRMKYAQEHGIQGVPFSAEWGDAMLRSLRRNR